MTKSLATTRRPGTALQSPFRRFFPVSLLDELSERLLSETNGDMSAMISTAMDIVETDQAFEVKMDLPGVNVKDVEIQVENNTLTVRGHRNEEKEEKDDARRYHRIERYSGSFCRSALLPNAVNEEEAVAEFKNGVLKITVPKAEGAKPRKINIKS
jgi:HSP20 family protein